MARGSPSPSSSSRSSATPPPTILKKKKKTLSSKEKSKKAVASGDAGKNEGEDLNWAYAPPPDAVLVGNENIDAGEFDWETLKNDDGLELWLIRVPESIKPKHLNGLSINIPKQQETACVGTLERKHSNFDVWSIGSGEKQPVGGEEIKGISCILPRKGKKGELYPEPKPIARHIVVTAQPVRPSHTNPVLHQNPPRFSYPKEVLKHRYIPFGSVVPGSDVPDAMAVDSEPQAASEAEDATVPDVVSEVKVKKGKKRKGDGDAVDAPSKKSKKNKVA